MADNVDVTEGSGKTVATDDIQVDGSHGQGQVQFMKLVDGTLNGTGSVRVNQAAKANALTVAPASDISDGTYIGDIKFGEALPANTNTQEVVGDVAENANAAGNPLLCGGRYDSSPRTLGNTDVGAIALAADGAVHIDDGGNTITVDGSLTTVTTVTTCSTVTAVTSLDKAVYVDDADWTDNTSSHTLVGGVYQSSPHTVTDGDVSPFGVDVNGNIVLGTGAKAIGKLAANSGIDIGDVDVTSIVPGVAATSLGKARDSVLGATDTGVMALAVRDDTLTTLTPADGDYVPLRVSSTGQLHVTGAGGGTEYTEDVATANPQVGSAIMVERDDALTTVTPVEADWIGLRGTAEGALWTQDFNSDAVKAAVEIMDDWDAVHDSAASSDGPQVMAAYDSTKPTAVGDADAVRVLADAYGRLLAGVEPQAFQATFNSADASGEGNAVHASAASTVIVVQSYVISVDAEMWVELQEEDSSELTGKFWLKAGGGVAITLPDKAPIVLGVDSDLEVITEGAGNVSVSVTGYTIPG